MALLQHRSDARMLAAVAAWYGLVGAQFVAPPRAAWVAVPLWAASCALGFIGGVATRNAMHTPVFRAPWLNHALQFALTLVYGHPASAFVPGHNASHHRHLETRRDVMRTAKASFRWHLLNLLLFPARISRDVLRAELRYARAMQLRDPAWTHQLVRETCLLVGTTSALLLLDWRRCLLYVLLPQLYTSWGILAMNLLQHDGCDAGSDVNQARNFVGRAINWCTFNNGYHTIHHLEPGLHWSELPAAHARRVAPHIHPALEQRSLVWYVLATFVVPGRRRRFDGAPLELDDAGVDEEWIPVLADAPPR